MEDFLYNFKSIYFSLPLCLRNSVGRAARTLPPLVRYGSFYRTYSQRIHNFLSVKDSSSINILQQKKICETVNWAVNNVPFYKKMKPIKTIDDLKKFPIMQKKDYIKDTSVFVAPLVRRYALPANTGGSSGIRMDFFLHGGHTRPKERAHFDWYWSLFGYSLNSRVLMIRGKPLQKRRLCEYQSFENRLAVSCHDNTESGLDKVIDAIRKFRPEYILAYPSALTVFTKLLGHISALGPEVKFKAVFCGSEVLPEADRTWFADFYRTQVVSWYGHSECVLHGGYLPGSNEYNFCPFYGYCELLDENDNEITEPGQLGRIVGTSFDNYVMPFIRYDTGDLGVLSVNSPSSCGFPVLSRIEGRGTDIVYLSDGNAVSMTSFLFAHRMTQFSKIRDMQLEQTAPGELIIRIVKGPGYREREDEQEITNRLVDSVRGRIRISVLYEDNIAKTPNGKHVVFRQKISQSEDKLNKMSN